MYVITTVPVLTPVTTAAKLIVATAVLLLLHIPPGVVLHSVVFCAVHTVEEPKGP